MALYGHHNLLILGASSSNIPNEFSSNFNNASTLRNIFHGRKLTYSWIKYLGLIDDVKLRISSFTAGNTKEIVLHILFESKLFFHFYNYARFRWQKNRKIKILSTVLQFCVKGSLYILFTFFILVFFSHFFFFFAYDTIEHYLYMNFKSSSLYELFERAVRATTNHLYGPNS